MIQTPLGWLQLKQEKIRFLVAIAGVAFAVVLILMQLGFRYALYKSSVRYHEAMVYDVVLVNAETQFIARPKSFSRRRLYQSLAVPGVESVEPVYTGLGIWQNPFDWQTRDIFVVGFEPSAHVFDIPGITSGQDFIKRRDAFLFDRASRAEFGPVAASYDRSGPVAAEVNDHEIEVLGLFHLGTSFGIDGSLLTSATNFLRLFPERAPGLIDLGLIRLQPGARLEEVRRTLRDYLPADVRILTKEEHVQAEIDYWARSTPIGYVFGFGVIVGVFVGSIIVYQILFADVSDHLPEYATLKAIGYSSFSLAGIVLQQAVILAILGFLPGLAIASWLYGAAGEATKLPLEMTAGRALPVLGLTMAMCSLAGLLALRKVRSADPAEIF